jgi:hypothetical protein
MSLARERTQRPTVRPALAVRARRIVIAVRDTRHHEETIDWALAHAAPGLDVIHLVHAYLPLQLTGCNWEPVVRARDARYWAARRVIALAQQRIARRAAVRPEGSAIAGAPADVLVELSEVVDLIVVGDDSTGAQASRRITWRVQDLASCPVVAVPLDHRPADDGSPPVTVLADEHGLSEAAMSFGAETALRRGTSVQISGCRSFWGCSGASSHELRDEQQRQLRAQLDHWTRRYPQLTLSARAELGADELAGVCRGSALVVAPSRSAPQLRAGVLRPSHPFPVAVVPG